MNQNPIDVDLTLALVDQIQRELADRSERERMLERADMAPEHHSPRRALGHGLIRLGYALMAPRDRIAPRTLNPVHF